MTEGRVDEVLVVVPARDEEATLPACLSALATTAARCGRLVRVRTVVVLDLCTDASAAVVAAASADTGVEAVTSTAGTAGGARGVGVAHGLGRRRRSLDRVWVATTDADSRVPEDWLEQQVAQADAGAAMVLGTVRLDPDETPRPLLAAWLAGYRHREGHHHVHAANLGVRADVLLAAGGFPAVTTGEDVALAATVEALGEPVVRTASTPVLTSSRRTGRSPDGFARFLLGLETG